MCIDAAAGLGLLLVCITQTGDRVPSTSVDNDLAPLHVLRVCCAVTAVGFL